MLRSVVVVVIVCAFSPARAQLRDAVPAELIGDGANLHAGATVVGAVDDAHDNGIQTDVAALLTWTRAGIDRNEGFRGPRWTNRWGAQLAGRIAAGTGDRPVELEQRGELAVYLVSLGERVAWHVRPRLTDRLWWSSDVLLTGAFVDFPGLGLVKHDAGDELGAEGFPIYAEIARATDGSTTVDAELAVARVQGRPGDVRIINHRLTTRTAGTARAVAWDFEAFSARRVELSRQSSWRMSGALGLSVVRPFYDRDVALAEAPKSIIPLARIGIEHVGTTPQVRARRSEIGRPLVDNADFGIELASLHRFVPAVGVDAGGQLTAWWSHPLDDGVVARGEGMFGVGARRLQLDPASSSEMQLWLDTRELVLLARVEVSLAAQLYRSIAAEVRLWSERSERSDPMAAARWEHGAHAGLSLRL